MANTLSSQTHPIVVEIPGGMDVGQFVEIHGTACHGKEFIASLQCGEEPTAYPGVAFQLKPQLDGTHDVGIVSLGGTEWVEMVTFLADFPFKPGMPFIIKVEALEKEYKVHVNGEHVEFLDFDHRFPLQEVRFLYLTGDAYFSSLHFDGSDIDVEDLLREEALCKDFVESSILDDVEEEEDEEEVVEASEVQPDDEEKNEDEDNKACTMQLAAYGNEEKSAFSKEKVETNGPENLEENYAVEGKLIKNDVDSNGCSDTELVMEKADHSGLDGRSEINVENKSLGTDDDHRGYVVNIDDSLSLERKCIYGRDTRSLEGEAGELGTEKKTEDKNGGWNDNINGSGDLEPKEEERHSDDTDSNSPFAETDRDSVVEADQTEQIFQTDGPGDMAVSEDIEYDKTYNGIVLKDEENKENHNYQLENRNLKTDIETVQTESCLGERYQVTVESLSAGDGNGYDDDVGEEENSEEWMDTEPYPPLREEPSSNSMTGPVELATEAAAGNIVDTVDGLYTRQKEEESHDILKQEDQGMDLQQLDDDQGMDIQQLDEVQVEMDSGREFHDAETKAESGAEDMEDAYNSLTYHSNDNTHLDSNGAPLPAIIETDQTSRYPQNQQEEIFFQDQTSFSNGGPASHMDVYNRHLESIDPNKSLAIPYIEYFSKGLSVGKAIYIDGVVVKDAKSFVINLQTNRLQVPNSDVALQINPCFDEGGRVACNYFLGDEWGPAEIKKHSPFKEGKAFSLIVLVDEDYFKIYVNDEHYCDFAHRVPIEKINFVLLDGDALFHTMEYPLELELPLSNEIPGGLYPGKTIYLHGYVWHGAESFELSLQKGSKFQSGGSVSLNFKTKVKRPKRAIFRTYCNDLWDYEENIQGFLPFRADSKLTIKISVEKGFFRITVNDRHVTDYTFRQPLSSVTHMVFEGDVSLYSVRYVDDKRNIRLFKRRGIAWVKENCCTIL